jgi:hypothetical protein
MCNTTGTTAAPTMLFNLGLSLPTSAVIAMILVRLGVRILWIALLAPAFASSGPNRTAKAL